ncbi:DUF3857 domain-containing protein [candidate division KSB1 bacterium]|nr:DUF3857 domain-containing protein [candidate division KSB1 bacterium]
MIRSRVALPCLCGLLALLSVTAAPLHAEFMGLPEGVKSNVKAIERYPRAAAVLLYVKESFVLQVDGAQTYEWHSFRYLPDEAARDLWGDPRVAYIEGEQQVEILAARSYTADGRQIEATPHNAYNSVTPDELSLAPEFSLFRQMVITMLGLENGSISEFHYRVTTAKPRFPWLSGRVYLREEVPTILRELVVQIPANAVLTFESEHGVEQPIQVNGVNTWRMGEQPGYLTEDLGGHRILLPNVAFSTAKDWKAVGGELKRRLEAAADSVAVPVSLQTQLRPATSEEGKLDSIKHWVAARFSRLEFEHPDFDVVIRPLARVLNSGYGNSLELAELVATFAQANGLRVDPVVWYPFEPAVPGLDHAIGMLRVQHGTVSFLCDPVRSRSQFASVDLAESCYLSTDSDAPTLQPLIPFTTEGNSLDLRVTLSNVEADTILGVGSFSAAGGFSPFESVREAGAEEFVADLLTLPDLSVNSAIVRELGPAAVSISFSFALPRFDTADAFRLLPTSLLALDPYLMSPPLTLEAKEFPFWIRVPGTITTLLNVPFPAKWNAVKTPAALAASWQGGSGSRTCKTEDHQVSVETRITNSNVWLPSGDWAQFRNFLIETGQRPNNAIGFVPRPD